MSIDPRTALSVIRQLAKTAACQHFVKKAQPPLPAFSPRQKQIWMGLGLEPYPEVPQRPPDLPADFPGSLPLPVGSGAPVPLPIRDLWKWRQQLWLDELREVMKNIEAIDQRNKIKLGLLPDLPPLQPPQPPSWDKLPTHIPSGIGGGIPVPFRNAFRRAWPDVAEQTFRAARQRWQAAQNRIDEHNQKKLKEFGQKLLNLGWLGPPPIPNDS